MPCTKICWPSPSNQIAGGQMGVGDHRVGAFDPAPHAPQLRSCNCNAFLWMYVDKRSTYVYMYVQVPLVDKITYFRWPKI